ncbi:hypothetical protein L2755_21240 [Shewanella abyssi]|uniref:hypothetical protein n=1 Tax=Shewanella abyssi TaxID=311789 RepID=UPI00200D0003|nr:hypothetical protein [Shewanella abyssi]MCL1052125.1 hypothetical protein [Shewanella abyssi]
MDDLTTLQKILAFLAKIEIEAREDSIKQATFLPGILIDKGQLIFDKEKLRNPGDLLHEAGHIAVTEFAARGELSGDVYTAGHSPADEMAAIAWSWAALQSIGLPSQVLFHQDGYKGASQNYIEAFSQGQGFGFPMLVYYDLCHAPNHSDGYPTMLKWLRC